MTTIHILTIDHQHGTDAYAFECKADAYDKLTCYCREWWHEIGNEDQPPADMSDDVIRMLYFEAMDSEHYELHETEIVRASVAA